ncbi:hypothetical protein B0J11DRAFT_259435 [Dendryphion nanum]|uniref:Uncharacterized protein n=1 Tax=Dendryphion nanum TaxID=256645 RepID=A0A9P9E4Q7_9PLEO|nr:hypothetical protein B0J11DRAFT_259435 [Dendryphion nanum]
MCLSSPLTKVLPCLVVHSHIPSHLSDTHPPLIPPWLQPVNPSIYQIYQRPNRVPYEQPHFSSPSPSLLLAFPGSTRRISLAYTPCYASCLSISPQPRYHRTSRLHPNNQVYATSSSRLVACANALLCCADRAGADISCPKSIVPCFPSFFSTTLHNHLEKWQGISHAHHHHHHHHHLDPSSAWLDRSIMSQLLAILYASDLGSGPRMSCLPCMRTVTPHINIKYHAVKICHELSHYMPRRVEYMLCMCV